MFQFRLVRREEVLSGAKLENLKHFQKRNNFTDLIFICKDMLYHAHKLVLSSVSNYSRNNLLSQDSSISTIFMTGTHPHDVENIICFIYSGEVWLPQAEIEGFFKASKLLHIDCFEPSEEFDISTELMYRGNKTLVQAQNSALNVSKNNRVGGSYASNHKTFGTSNVNHVNVNEIEPRVLRKNASNFKHPKQYFHKLSKHPSQNLKNVNNKDGNSYENENVNYSTTSDSEYSDRQQRAASKSKSNLLHAHQISSKCTVQDRILHPICNAIERLKEAQETQQQVTGPRCGSNMELLITSQSNSRSMPTAKNKSKPNVTVNSHQQPSYALASSSIKSKPLPRPCPEKFRQLEFDWEAHSDNEFDNPTEGTKRARLDVSFDLQTKNQLPTTSSKIKKQSTLKNQSMMEKTAAGKVQSSTPYYGLKKIKEFITRRGLTIKGKRDAMRPSVLTSKSNNKSASRPNSTRILSYSKKQTNSQLNQAPVSNLVTETKKNHRGFSRTTTVPVASTSNKAKLSQTCKDIASIIDRLPAVPSTINTILANNNDNEERGSSSTRNVQVTSVAVSKPNRQNNMAPSAFPDQSVAPTVNSTTINKRKKQKPATKGVSSRQVIVASLQNFRHLEWNNESSSSGDADAGEFKIQGRRTFHSRQAKVNAVSAIKRLACKGAKINPGICSLSYAAVPSGSCQMQKFNKSKVPNTRKTRVKS